MSTLISSVAGAFFASHVMDFVCDALQLGNCYTVNVLLPYTQCQLTLNDCAEFCTENVCMAEVFEIFCPQNKTVLSLGVTYSRGI